MSKICTCGHASEEFEVDTFIITFTINIKSTSSGDAIKKGKEQTEYFLKLMQDNLEIEPASFILEDYSVKTGYSSDSLYEYSKEIKLNMKADLKLLEIMNLLLENMDNVKSSLTASLSNEAQLEEAVIKKAIEDSRKKAEILAAATGHKVIGFEDINYGYRNLNDTAQRCLAKSIVADDYNDLASQMKKPLKKINSEVNIIWITEEI